MDDGAMAGSTSSVLIFSPALSPSAVHHTVDLENAGSMCNQFDQDGSVATVGDDPWPGTTPELPPPPEEAHPGASVFCPDNEDDDRDQLPPKIWISKSISMEQEDLQD